MADLLLDELPQQLDGRPINSDFRPMCWMSNQLLRGRAQKDINGFTAELFRRFYRTPISMQESPAAFAAALRFYSGATPENSKSTSTGSHSAEVYVDYETDAAYIVAAFQQAYGIDLTKERIHWWRFRALLSALPEDTKLSKIVEIRCKDLSKITDPELRQQYQELQEIYDLPKDVKGGRPHIASVPEHDSAFLARFAPRE